MNTTYDMDVTEQGGACQMCGAPGGYPYCQNGNPSCADTIADELEEEAIRELIGEPR